MSWFFCGVLAAILGSLPLSEPLEPVLRLMVNRLLDPTAAAAYFTLVHGPDDPSAAALVDLVPELWGTPFEGISVRVRVRVRGWDQGLGSGVRVRG